VSSSKWEKDVRCQSVDDWSRRIERKNEEKESSCHATVHPLKPKPGITVSAKRNEN
jgi:hypothetical protein